MVGIDSRKTIREFFQLLMPEEIQLMKFPSVSRLQRIFTILVGSVNFAFSIVDNQIPNTKISQN